MQKIDLARSLLMKAGPQDLVLEHGTMDNTSYIALSREAALQRQMGVVANNMANANTPGFKSEQMMFTS